MTIAMPLLKPVPILTKGLPLWKKILILFTHVRKWELVSDWLFVLPNGITIVIPGRFVMDGASTPRFLWGILEPTGILLIQGIIHDFGYRYDYLWIQLPDGSRTKIYVGAGRKHWDDLFLSVGQTLTEMTITGWLSWVMLRIFGSIAWRENRELNEPDILVE